MRIGIESSTLSKASPEGTGRYTAMLLENLPAQTDASIARLCHWSRFRARGALAGDACQPVRLWADAWPATARYDIVHATSHRVPVGLGGVCIVTVHDVYAAMGFKVRGQAEALKGMRRLRRIRARAQQVICISHRSRQDWLEYFDFPEERAHVVHHGVSGRFQPQPEDRCHELRLRHAGGQPYLLFLGGYRQNKNIERLLEAYAGAALRHDFRLLLTGLIGSGDRQRLLAWLAARGLQDRVRLTGYVPDEQLPLLYAAAQALLLPSLYEGFGLTILEAMASATPVLTSTAGACPEVAAGHATLVDPYSVEDIRRGLEQVVRMTPARVAAALAHARTKTWAETARQTLAVYRCALGQPEAGQRESGTWRQTTQVPTAAIAAAIQNGASGRTWSQIQPAPSAPTEPPTP